ncbi:MULTISPECIES: helix-turn-helix domain-containing protein [unclassified Pseudonocardia]|uniref:helix-turn-helix domain-containing protein n=1 Tax=unclassified Pseudonocardia TaxID=2619320 RepID=UPI00094AE1FA|nr:MULTISPECIES: helix-turn-helix domain-containing protein [unclassified Pseudonocardia]
MTPGADLQTLVDDLADELGRSVVVNDPMVRMLCTSRHFGDEDAVRVRAVLQRDAGPEVGAHVLGQGVARWGGPGFVRGGEELGMHDRWCVPLREDGVLLGLLMVIDAGRTLAAAERARIDEVARTAAALLHRDRTGAGDRERERLLLRLVGPDPLDRAAAVRESGTTGPGAAAVVEVGAALPAPEVEVALRATAGSPGRRPDRTLAAVDDGRAVLVASRPDVDVLAADAERIVLSVEHLLGRTGVAVAGIGPVVPSPELLWRSAGRAAAAARGARLVPGLGPVARWDGLGPYAPLLQLPPAELDADLVPAPLVALRADPRAARLVETLRAYLDHGGSIPRTAQALHLHRTSLYYRLDQIRAVTGLDLDDGRDRLLLHLGLLVADLTG